MKDAIKLFLSFFLLFICANPAISQVSESDSLELVNFYAQVCNVECDVNWDLDMPVGTWDGIGVTDGKVVEISLAYDGLTGSLPDLQLPDLVRLVLYGNDIGETIPNFTGLPSLEVLDLHQNDFTGLIPDFSNLPNLTEVDLSRNFLGGCFEETLTALCGISYNFSYNFSLPADGDFSSFCENGFGVCAPMNVADSLELVGLYDALCNDGCTLDWDMDDLAAKWYGVGALDGRVEFINLYNNGLSGNIPDLNLPFLKWLALTENNLTGTIPDFANLPNLKNLYLRDNNLTGTIPNFTNLPNLSYLSLRNNQLTGTLPELGGTPNLTGLDFRNNELSGCIPLSFGNFCNYVYNFLLSGNPELIGGGDFYSFCGSGYGSCAYRYVEPSDSLALVELYSATCNEGCTLNWDLEAPAGTWSAEIILENGKVVNLTLENKNLSGAIPDLNLSELQGLYLGHNQLSDTIPNFTQLPDLVYLHLDDNELSGTIPDFTNLPNLVQLNLEDNQLSGSLPGFGNVPQLVLFNISNNQLSGCIPESLNNFCSYPYYFSFDNNPGLPSGGNFYAFCNYDFGGCNYIFVEPADSLALVELYQATCNEGCTLNWDLNQPIGIWDSGIEIYNDRITQLNLNDKGLSGTLPDDLNLTALTEISLEGNNLTGAIPSFANSPNLDRIQMRYNQLSGCFPAWLDAFCYYDANFSGNPDLPGGGSFNNFCSTQFGSCEYVYVNPSDSLALVELYNATCNDGCELNWDLNEYVNLWDSGITLADGNVTSLVLYQRGLSGNLSDLNLPNLESLELNFNNLSGSIPDFSNLSNLEYLELNGNQFSDTIPHFSNLTNLRYLELQANMLTGPIPDLSALTQLSRLYLNSNQLSGCFPDWLNNRCNGGYYHFDYNYDLPGNGNFAAFCNSGFGSCNYIYVDPSDSLALVELYNATCNSNCQLGWDLNSPAFHWDPNIKWADGRVSVIELLNKNLSGSIPDLNLPELTEFNLSRNQLSGTIPSFTQLPNLTELSLYDNELSDSIPDFANQPNLTSLILSGNQLSGSVPDFTQPNLTSLNLSDNQLTGSIPDFTQPNLTSLNLSDNQLSGCFPATLKNYCDYNYYFRFLNNPDLPENGNFTAFCANDFGSCEYIYVHPSDSLALVTLYNATCNQGCALDWDLNQNVTNWNSEIVITDGRVTSIDLSYKNLNDTLPNLILPQLEYLNLESNSLAGNIPPFYNTLNLKTIELGSNNFTGNIPDLAHLTQLAKFEAQYNQLGGCFPDWLNNLCNYFYNIRLIGNADLPDNGDISSFCSNGFGSCGYTPVHPSDSLELVKLYTENCNTGCSLNWDFSEPAATWYSGIVIEEGRVKEININSQYLSDTIPALNLPNLTHLNLEYNNLVGSIPNISGLPSLTRLDLSDNNLSGCFSDELNVLCGLSYDFSDNSGLPGSGNFYVFCNSGVGSCNPTNASDSLQLVNFYNAVCNQNCNLNWNLNQLVNTWSGITTSEGRVTKIVAINKNLSGDIPALNLPELTLLNLNSNQLTGPIPDLSDLPNLEYIYLNENQLSGCFSDDLNALCGGVVYNFANNSGLPNNGDFAAFCDSSFGSCNYVFVEPSDSLELVKFYNLACGSGCTLDWDLNQSVNYWGGLTISDAGRVTEIRLRYENLTGQIPVLDLPELAVYDLYGNSFSGCYPEALSAVCDIEYNFNANFNLPLNGSLHYFCGGGGGSCLGISTADSLELVKLYTATCNDGCNLDWDLEEYVYEWTGVSILDGRVTNINASSKGLSGNIPVLNFPELTLLNLSSNQLTGLIPDMSGMPNLNTLSLSYNQLSGCFPSALSDFCGTANVNLSSNYGLPDNGNFSAFCNNGFGRCGLVTESDSLELIKLYNANCNANCTLDWDLNEPVITWEGITIVDERVDRIRLTDKGLDGNIPTLNLPELTDLTLSNNQLSGPIPDVSNLPNLNSLYLNNNQLSDCFSDDIIGLCDISVNFSQNEGLPAGGNFSAFCNTGFGTCNATNAADSLELVNFYNTNCIDCSLTWDFDQRVSTWQGVSVAEGRVSRLIVGNRNLTGNIPDLNLPELRYLSLSSNNLSGTIPDFSYVPNLETLILNYNDLSGNVFDFNNLPNLKLLTLAQNNLTDTIPEFVNMPHLTRLELNNNNLVGNVPTFINLPDLEHVNLSNNQLSGCFPDELASLCNGYFSIHGNSELPNNGNFNNFCNDGLGSCTPFNQVDSLELVSFYNAVCNDGCTLNWDFDQPVRTWNGVTIAGSRVAELSLILEGLSGSLPDLNLPNLTLLSLRFEYNLSGTIPDFTNLSKLKELTLLSNGLAGGIPNFTNLPELEKLDLARNDLSGVIPDFANLPNLTIIDLSNNNLSGCFSDALIPLCDIDYDFRNNSGLPENGNFSAFCEYGLGSCDPTNPQDSLELVNFYTQTCNTGCTLDWDFNQPVNTWEGITTGNGRVVKITISSKGLSENIPDLNLPELRRLDLRYNDLTGNIPGFTNLTALEYIDLRFNELSGCFSDDLLPLCDILAYFNYNTNLPQNGNFSGFCNDGIGSCDPINSQDSLQLVNFYNTTCNEDCTLNWDFDSPISTWEGISIANGSVLIMDLDYKGLSGNIPDLNLPELKHLYLNGNNLTGNIPTFVNLPQLENINLSFNQLSGCFSDVFIPLCDITYNFSYNEGLPLNGDFSVFCNNGTGACAPIHPSDSLQLVNFYNATCNDACTLDWDFNNLVASWEGVSTQDERVIQINLNNKGLTGDIPNLNLPQLTHLGLNNNQLTGPIPNFTNLPELQSLWLANNLLSGCFSEELMYLCDLNFQIHNNPGLPGNGSFSSFCNSGFGSCSPTNPQDSLELVNFYNTTCNSGCTLGWDLNQLVNSWVGILTVDGRVTQMNLHSKGLTENIPDLNLPELTQLYLYGNALSGNIPTFSNLTNLQQLYLQNNQLSGCFPDELSELCDINSYFSGNSGLPGGGDFTAFCEDGYGRCGFVSVSDSLELVNFYNTTCGDGCTLNWDFNTPVATWEGVSALGNLILQINISGKGLSGMVPDLNLPDLTRLGLPNNNLTGEIPIFTNLPNLATLNMSANQLSGCFADETAIYCGINYDFEENVNLPDNGNFDFFCNSGFGSCTPTNLSDSLELVNFYNLNCGDGCTLDWDFDQLVSSWEGIKIGNGRVIEVNLYFKGLTGTIPNLNLPELTLLNLSSNNLSGTIPAFSYLTNLTEIRLNNNNLGGCFSDSLIPLCGITYNFTNNPNLPDSGDFAAFCNTGLGSCTPINAIDSLELISFYMATCGEDCTLQWDFDQPVASWEGVKISGSKVTELNIEDKNLSGNIPDLNLSELTILNLSNNNLSGEIPVFLNPTKLEVLNLATNQLNASIPDFTQVPNLIYINLNDNALVGEIPILTHLLNLQSFYAENNQLSGCFSNQLLYLCDLNYSFIGNSELAGGGNLELFCNYGLGNCAPINEADSLGLVNFYNANCNEGCTLNWDFDQRAYTWEGLAFSDNRLIELSLSNKNLSGNIYPIDFPFMEKLNLKNNDLTGNIPNFDMPLLAELNFSRNQLSGEIPDFDMPYLGYLNLSNNQLSGEIPNFNLPDLGILHLGNNQLSGEIPNFDMPYLEDVRLPKNQLTGNIPNFDMPYLRILQVQHNQLTGEIPAFSLPFLGVFLAYNNQLTGPIPDFEAPLVTLHLFNNNLSGTIPTMPFGAEVFIFLNDFSQQDIAENYAYNEANNYNFFFSPQFFGNEQFHTDTIGATVVLSPDPSIPYAQPKVRWLQNDEFITSYSLNDTTHVIPSLDTADIGVYQYRFIDYTLYPEVEFYSRPINNYVEGLDLEGEPIIQGELILEYGIDQSPTKIDSIRNELITEYGGVILDSCGCAVQLDLWKFGEDTLDIVRGIIGIDGTGDRRTSSTEIDGNRDNLFVPDYNEAEYILIGEPTENPNDTAKVVVGVVDTGINVYHNAVYDNLWRNQAEQNGMPGIDDDQNGYTDDIFGYDFITDSLMRDEHGHGTKVGGIITANTPEDMDIQVMPVRTFNEEGRGLLFDMLCGIYYAIDNGSDVINISAGYKGEKSVILQKALQYGRDRDVLFVVAAGNDTLDLNAINYWPAAFTRDTTLENTVITVTAVDSMYNLAEYASYGDTTVTIATSGQSILAPAEYDLESFDYIGGTSASTPIVSLALSMEKIKNPNKSRASLREDFLNNADIAADLIDVVEEGRMLNIETRLLSKLKVLLEGALLNPGGTYSSEMKTTLNNRGLLPGQTPLSPLATPTPSGQPYTASPWDYTGTEWGSTDYYLEDRVDWVLVSLRTERESASEIYRTAAQLKKDGTVEFYRPIMDFAGIADSVYIVVEHRNHMAVMSPEKVPVSHGRFVYDFTAEDSFRNPTAVGQVEVAPGVWAMIVGDSSQENDFPHYDINGDDKAIWVDENGNYDQYMPSDYNMDGDANGSDKAIWSSKIGLSNRVPK